MTLQATVLCPTVSIRIAIRVIGALVIISILKPLMIRCHLGMPLESAFLEPECPSHLSLPDDLLKLGAMPLFGRFLLNLKEMFVLGKLFVSLPQVMKFALLGRDHRIFLLFQSCILHLQIRYSLITVSQLLTNPVEGGLGNIAQCEHPKRKHKVLEKESRETQFRMISQ